MSNDFEQQWAKTLKQTKQQTTKKKLPIKVQEKQIKEEMEYFKNKLKKNTKDKNKIQIKKTYQTLIKLRAKLCVIEMKKKEEESYLDEETRNKLIADYIKDCTRLKNGINNFLKTF